MTVPAQTTGLPATLRRIWGMVLRHYYLFKGSWPRLLDLIYWPTLQMTLWGFITVFLAENSTWIAQAAGVLISAVLLWDILFRGQISLFLSFVEELWSRNLGHLFVSPLRPWELIAALLTVSLIRTMIGVGGASALAIVFFDTSLFALGLPLAAFVVNLIATGWALGLVVCGLILRFGLGAENLAWALVFLIQPFSGVYYPIDVLPGWMQAIAWCLPSAHVFEGMRAIVIDHTVRTDLLVSATLINMVFIATGASIFMRVLHQARVRGQLMQIGE